MKQRVSNKSRRHNRKETKTKWRRKEREEYVIDEGTTLFVVCVAAKQRGKQPALRASVSLVNKQLLYSWTAPFGP